MSEGVNYNLVVVFSPDKTKLLIRYIAPFTFCLLCLHCPSFSFSLQESSGLLLNSFVHFSVMCKVSRGLTISYITKLINSYKLSFINDKYAILNDLLASVLLLELARVAPILQFCIFLFILPGILFFKIISRLISPDHVHLSQLCLLNVTDNMERQKYVEMSCLLRLSWL